MVFGPARGFRRTRAGIRLSLDAAEIAILEGLLGQLVDLVAPGENRSSDPLAALIGIDPDAAASDDPAVRRLFPDGYSDDPEASAEFRRFTERGLRQRRSERIATTVGVLERIERADKPQATELDRDEADAFLGALNDLRLVLGSRLGIESDDDVPGAGWPDDDPRLPLLAAYQWLTWLQASLLDCLTA